VSRITVKAKKRGTTRNRQYFLGLLSIGFLIMLVITILLSPVAPESVSRDVPVVIPSQATAGEAAQILKKNELVRNPLAFRLYARWKGMDGKIKAGEYLINNNLSTPEILQALVDGRLATQDITVPEGLTTAQVADLLVAKGIVNRENFYSAVANHDFAYEFIEGLPEGERRLEGYLFPDTYQIVKGSSEISIINMMLKRFEMEINELDYTKLSVEAGITLHEAVTIASMVEREARIDEERPVIAGVIYNRMNRGMLLQIDATIQYALGTNKAQIYYKDLEIDSTYNTYLNQGLPPGPIAMPGRSSLIAAVSPARTEYLYYVAKEDGTHAFATNFDEHENNKERYQQ